MEPFGVTHQQTSRCGEAAGELSSLLINLCLPGDLCTGASGLFLASEGTLCMRTPQGEKQSVAGVLRSCHGVEDGRLARQTEATLVVEGMDQP